MTATDFLLTMLAVSVALLLARGTGTAKAALLVVSALAISGMLFLPTEVLTGWLGADRVDSFQRVADKTPLDSSEWIHFLAFTWLGSLLWLARKGLRTWSGVLLIAALGVAAELSQWLTEGREPHLADAALNVSGAGVGIILAAFALAVSGKQGADTP